MNALKKYADLSFLLFFILFMGFIIYSMFIKPTLNLDKIQTSINNYKQSDVTPILYYDDTVTLENVKIYENALNKYPELNNQLFESGIKVVVSENLISETLFSLYGDTSEYQDNMKGAYFKEYKLIIIKDFDVNKEILSKKLNVNQTKSELSKINKEMNTNVLYHEIGHFIIGAKDPEFIKNQDVIKSYKEESNLIFGTSNLYVCSDIEEFVAECISNYLNYGYVEYSNKDLEKGYTEINHLIENFLTIN